MSRSAGWWLAGGVLVLVQAGVLAALFTPAPHPGGDNAGYLALGHALASGQGYVELWSPGAPPHTKYPPAFPALLALLMLGGAATWGAFKVVMTGLVSLAGILVFAWAGGRRGALAGLAVALLTLLSSGWLEASRWILSEPLFLVFVFLTLWAAERGGPGEGRWTLAACAGALLAFLARSAGLPLVLAVLAWLLLARRWKAAASFAGVVALVGGAWFLRARGGAEGAYQSDFWMVNPYDPALGTIGPGDLVARAGENLVTYVGTVLPGEWWGGEGVALPIVGGLLALLALAGWGLRLRSGLRARSDSGSGGDPAGGDDPAGGVGVAELFLPLYAGLILIWPQVWAGDRFVLVLYPLLLLYAGEALAALVGRLRSRRVERSGGAEGSGIRLLVIAVAFLGLALPAVPTLLDKAGEAAECRDIAGDDPFRCLGAPMMEFREAAGWAGENLPENSVVLNRKPRIFYTLGGTAGRTFPFRSDPEGFLAEADRVGGDYLLMDAVDGVSIRYLPPLLDSAPGAFCWVIGWGRTTDLLGILPAGERGGDALTECPRVGAGGVGGTPARDPSRIPIL